MAVSDSNLPPEQWRSLFDAIGVDFGYRALATHTGMTHTAIWRFMRGEGTSDTTARGIADAFNVPVSKVYELRGETVSIHEPFTLPDDAGRLNHNEREVIRSIVRALLDARGEQVAVHTDSTPPARASGQGGSPEEDGLQKPKRRPPLRRPRGRLHVERPRKDGTDDADDSH